MIIQHQNNLCKVHTATDSELSFINDFLSFENTNAERQRKAGYTVEDKVRLFSMKKRTFPSGLLPLLLRKAPVEGFNVEVIDQRNAPVLGPLPESVEQWLRGKPFTLRDYQLEAIRRISEPSKPECTPGRGIVWMPTGSGKGMLAPAIASTFPGPWVFLVHRTHLAKDIADRWESLTGKPSGFIGGGREDYGPDYEFTVATMQTLRSRFKKKPLLDWAKTVQGVLVDECHVCPSKLGMSTIPKFESAAMRIGLSGTPLDRGDQRSLMAVGLLGPILYRIKAETLIDAGVLARPTIHMLQCEQSGTADDWHGIYKELISESEKRNKVIIQALKKSEKPAMVFVDRIQHGLTLKKMAEKAGLTVAFVNGDKDAFQRDRACKDLADARLDAVIATGVFNEGVNIPSLRTVLLASGGRSFIKVLQQVGRVLRTSEGKTEATIYDILDTGQFWLEKHARARMAAFAREGYKVVEDTTDAYGW